jgi:hypothetical protein
MISSVRTTIVVSLAVLFMSACTDESRQPSHSNEVSEPSQASSSVPAHVREYVSRFIPQDAIDPVSTTEVLWVQQTFDVSRKPFDFVVSEEQLMRARSDGWTLCQELAPEWEGFYDATVTPRRYVRQKVYLLYKEGVLLTLIGRYYGTSQVVLDQQLRETSDVVQHAVVKGQESTQAELKEAIESFGLSCDQAAPVH